MVDDQSPGDVIFDKCVDMLGPSRLDADLMSCIMKGHFGTPEELEGQFDAINGILICFAAYMVCYMQAGFAMLCAGCVQSKNVANTMLKNMLDACGAAIAFFCVGYAFAYGGMDPDSSKVTFIGTSNFFLLDFDDHSFWLFQYAFSASATTIVAGTLAERCQMTAYLCYSAVLGGFVYPIIVHAIWNPNGFLSAYSKDPIWGVGMVDFSGSGVVHMTGGATAFFATMVLGARKGRFFNDLGQRLEKPKEFPQHSVALQMLGTFILWFGWFAFNVGTALTHELHARELVAICAVNTVLAGSTSGLTSLFVNYFKLERTTGEGHFDVKYLMNGLLSGCVAITGGCAIVKPWGAVAVGVVSGLNYMFATWLIPKLLLDDAVDAIPVHLFNGMWGIISVGLLASPERMELAYGNTEHAGWLYDLSDPNLLFCQIIGLAFIYGWITVTMLPFFVWLDWNGWFRANPVEEMMGLDVSYHGKEGAKLFNEAVYPRSPSLSSVSVSTKGTNRGN